MRRKKTVERVRRAKLPPKTQDIPGKFVRVPSEYFLDGYYYPVPYPHTVAASLAACILE